MDWSSLRVTAGHVSSAVSGLNLTVKVIGTLLLAILVRKAISRPKPYKTFPTWAILEIAVANYVLRSHGVGRRIFSSVRRYGGSLFGITTSHQVLVDLPGVDRLMAQSIHTLSAEPVQYTLFVRVFGASDSPTLKKKLEKSWKDLATPLEKLFLNETAATAAVESAGVPERAAAFITFSPDAASMRRWERSAEFRVVQPDLPDRPGVAEANFQSLVRDFGACMAIPLLYGRDFLDLNPQLLDDFWEFDNNLFHLLMIGMPSWAPLKVVKGGLRARSRILHHLEALYRRIDQLQKGADVDPGMDVSDVSFVAFERNKVYERDGWSLAERATADFTILWGQNANTHPVLFWLLLYIYSTPGLLGRVRGAIAPFVQLTTAHPRGIASMDHSGLAKHCPLLKACVFETYRLTNEPTSIRYVAQPITISDGGLKHTIRAGTFVSAAHSLVNHDPAVYAQPDRFIPERFLVQDAESGEQTARYGRLRPWGAGASMCKGRTFAEREILSLGAALVSLWEIRPASGTWELPAMVPGTGVKKPVKDIRVAISRRVF